MSQPICAAEGCDRPRHTRGWCRPHYERWVKHGDPLASVPFKTAQKVVPECSVEGCARDAMTRTWCVLHYSRWRKHGDIQATKMPMRAPRAAECSIEGCTKTVRARTWCNKHYQRWKRYGDPGICLLREVINACGINECQRPKYKSGVCYRHHREFTELFLAQQQACCAICKISLTAATRGLVLDHCHKTGQPRGLLCQFCNSAIGFMKDDTRLLLAAIDYLESSRQSSLYRGTD